ncbi:MAG: hypothetical protein WC889_08215, partial [Myxococcota bacterium]
MKSRIKPVPDVPGGWFREGMPARRSTGPLGMNSRIWFYAKSSLCVCLVAAGWVLTVATSELSEPRKDCKRLVISATGDFTVTIDGTDGQTGSVTTGPYRGSSSSSRHAPTARP